MAFRRDTQRHRGLPRGKCPSAKIHHHLIKGFTLGFVDRHGPGQAQWVLGKRPDDLRLDAAALGVVAKADHLPFVPQDIDPHPAVEPYHHRLIGLASLWKRVDPAEIAVDPATRRVVTEEHDAGLGLEPQPLVCRQLTLAKGAPHLAAVGLALTIESLQMVVVDLVGHVIGRHQLNGGAVQ